MPDEGKHLVCWYDIILESDETERKTRGQISRRKHARATTINWRFFYSERNRYNTASHLAPCSQ